MDFDSNSSRSSQTINALLCSPSATLQPSGRSHAPSGLLPRSISPPRKVLFKGSILKNPATQPGSSSNPPGPLTETGVTSNTKSTQSSHSFFELCVNSGKFLKSLGEISVSSTNAHGVNSIDTDGEFFRKVKDNYLRLRSFRARFWLLKPVNVSYVRVSFSFHSNPSLRCELIGRNSSQSKTATGLVFSTNPLRYHQKPKSTQKTTTTTHVPSKTSFLSRLISSYTMYFPVPLLPAVRYGSAAFRGSWTLVYSRLPLWLLDGACILTRALTTSRFSF